MPAQDLIIDLVIRYGFQVLGAFVILGVGLAAAWWVGNVVERPLIRMALEPPMRRLMVRVVRVVVLLFALVIALDKFGFQIAPLVAGIGVAGIGIGIALQGVLSNVIAGLTIIFTKPFRVGEHVEVVGMKGDVHTIELFSTTLLHPDRSRIIIPNRKIVGEILHNFGNTRQIHLAVMVPHGSDLTAVLALVREVVVANTRVLTDPSPVVGVAQLELAGVRVGVNPWVRVADVVAAEAELYRALVDRFAAAGVQVPLPKQEVRVLMSS
ncbi:MAG TPA: mechanosensitive ion channel family protein [Candidatus Eisenbacteria bacterium]|jgi:small conductance mechanosensitive channel|nr:mechanosensitive ion channel family protein [Candidatus Eisenbacteria bacterium]